MGFYADRIRQNTEALKATFDQFIEESIQAANFEDSPTSSTSGKPEVTSSTPALAMEWGPGGFGFKAESQKTDTPAPGTNDQETYVAQVREQAKRMDVHNALRSAQESDGEVYRTYTILKALYNLTVSLNNEGKILGFNTTDGKPLTIDNATAEDLLNFVKKYDFTSCVKKYQKFKKLPISLEELKTHIAGARLKLNAKLSKFKTGETVYLTDKPRRYGQTRTRMAKIQDVELWLKVNGDEEVGLSLKVNGDTLPTICRASGDFLGSSVSRHPPLGWQPPFEKGNTVYTEDGKEGTIFNIFPYNKSLWLDFADGTPYENNYPMAKVSLTCQAANPGRRRLSEVEMSPSELALHRRRLACGDRVSPVLAALMEEIKHA